MQLLRGKVVPLLLSCEHSPAVQIAAFLATFLPLWESREVLIRILIQAATCNKATEEDMQKFGSFMGKPGVPRVRVCFNSFLGK
jgi:hypothetical protein